MLPRATPRPSGAGDVLTNAGSRETTICCHAVKHHVTREKKREEMIKLARGGPSQSWLLGGRLNQFDARSCVDFEHLRHESERGSGPKRTTRCAVGKRCKMLLRSHSRCSQVLTRSLLWFIGTTNLDERGSFGFFVVGKYSTADPVLFCASPTKIACRDQGEVSHGRYGENVA